MITAILNAGILTGKMKLIERVNELDIVIPMPIFSISGDLLNPKLSTTPRFRFVWKRQIKRFTHEYVLKEVV
jgi:hypothetical protein